jgi:predicted metal-dependent phosphoesterase TrpH
MPNFKVQFHCHTKQDPEDYISHSERALIDRAAKQKTDLLSITCHNVIIFNDDLKKYAAKKRIKLIPGIEKSIEKKHVLIINASIEAQRVETFDDLKQYRKMHPESLIIAAHPFYPGPTCIRKNLDKNIDLFDALEYSWFHTRKRNKYNKKAALKAEKYGKTLLGTSDNHILRFLNETYSIVESKSNKTKHIIDAIKNNKVKIVSHDLSFTQLLRAGLETFIRGIIKKFTPQ